MDDSNSQTLASEYISHLQIIKITGIFTQCSECLLVHHPKGGKLTINNLKMSNFPWVAPTPSWGKPLIAIGALKKTIKKGDCLSHFITKREHGENFSFKWSFVRRDWSIYGSRPVSFMVRVIAILTTKVAFVISLQATGENNCHPLCHNVIVFNVKTILNG